MVTSNPELRIKTQWPGYGMKQVGRNGPLKYWSMTVFNDISAEMLRNFYMDNHYRKQWDNTVVEHNQLQLDESDGSEVGRTVKKI
ncbi:hypothetical protein RYX36_033509, partial [Vicia faba]